MIAKLEGSPADAKAVTDAIGGRTPTVSPQATKEFLRGGGDKEALRGFLKENGGRVGSGARTSDVNNLMGRGLKEADAKVGASALRDGNKVLTRDKKFQKKVPELTEGF
ncbi:MAG: hypothetical protein AB7O52_19650 [Planctomycetota bacterium]